MKLAHIFSWYVKKPLNLRISHCRFLTKLSNLLISDYKFVGTGYINRYFLSQKPVGGVAVLPAGGLFSKKEKEDKDNRVPNLNQNGLDTNETPLNSSGDSDKLKDKKGKSKVYSYSYVLLDKSKMVS